MEIKSAPVHMGTSLNERFSRPPSFAGRESGRGFSERDSFGGVLKV